ncbi:sigma-70 family RNA polymerase sigma factor [Streptomyces sp. NPDC048275]|uniref:sigma-70 family RNA polymerase sigma factor n=1 Tax=Streptomyces sp. NPDC048275 TaxID=3155629 RepID=UPI0033D45EEB
MQDSELPNPATLEETARHFMQVRPRLVAVADRMVASTAEAEDVVQDVWLRWQGLDRSGIRSATAFLTTMTVRLAINRKHSSRVRREICIGPWQPEPVDTSAAPWEGAERDETLSLAVLRLMERLNPTERAAYILREVFEYPYARLAALGQTNEVHARQLVSRARKHLSTERRQHIDQDDHRRLTEAFLKAARSGDTPALEAILTEHVTSSG